MQVGHTFGQDEDETVHARPAAAAAGFAHSACYGISSLQHKLMKEVVICIPMACRAVGCPGYQHGPLVAAL
jgi:hypothetical protein